MLPLCGGRVEVTLCDIPEVLASVIFEDVLREGLRLEKIFNFFDPSSEISRLNASRSAFVSPELLEVLATALLYCQRTDGAYDISKGKQFLARKLKRSLPSVACSYKEIIIEGDHVRLAHPDVLIDMGSIAKGYIVDRMIDFLENAGVESGFIDARGDMRGFGGCEEWMSIQHPRDEAKTIFPFTVKDESVATSGDYRQFDGSPECSHILGQRDFVSVTVVADTCMMADVIASCVFVLGSDAYSEFLRGMEGVEVLAIDKALKISATMGSRWGVEHGNLG